MRALNISRALMFPAISKSLNQTGVPAADVPVEWLAQRTVNHWAKASGVGVRQFEKIFKAEMGIAPKQWIEQRRLFAAIDRLAKGASIKAIAITMGYYNTIHFNWDFKKAFGMSPQHFMTAFKNRRDKDLTLAECAFLELSAHFYSGSYLTDSKTQASQSDSGALSGRSGRPVGRIVQTEKKLTKRECEILRLLGKGLLNKEISGKLGLSIATVKWHLERLYEKLGARNRVGAMQRYKKQ